VRPDRPSRKRGLDPGQHHVPIPPWSGGRIGRRAPDVAALLHVNEARRPTGNVAGRTDARVRQPRCKSHLHIVRAASDTVATRVEDIGREDDPAAGCGRGRRLDVRRERMERGWRGDDAVAQEHIIRACVVSMKLEMPREWVARIDLLESHLEDRLCGV
jgi:hypothetical protein